MIPLRDTVPTRTAPVLTVILIVVNLAVFLVELRAPAQELRTTSGIPVRVDGFDAITSEYGFVPCEVQASCPLGEDVVDFGRADVVVHHVPPLLTVLTSMFMHGGWEHVLGNMLFLWIFGNNVEDRLGRPRFILFYLLGGIAAAAAQFVIDPGSDVPNIGASGAIAAVLGGYILLYPLASVLSYVPPFFFFPVPAFLFLGIWFVLQVFLGTSSQVGAGGGGGVAYFAHIGGFAFGLLTVRLWTQRPPPAPRYG